MKAKNISKPIKKNLIESPTSPLDKALAVEERKIQSSINQRTASSNIKSLHDFMSVEFYGRSVYKLFEITMRTTTIKGDFMVF